MADVEEVNEPILDLYFLIEFKRICNIPNADTLLFLLAHGQQLPTFWAVLMVIMLCSFAGGLLFLLILVTICVILYYGVIFYSRFVSLNLIGVFITWLKVPGPHQLSLAIVIFLKKNVVLRSLHLDDEALFLLEVDEEGRCMLKGII